MLELLSTVQSFANGSLLQQVVTIFACALGAASFCLSSLYALRRAS